MLVRHGLPFWRELIGDNYVNRAAGRHGDRGTFEYYLEWMLYGTFPWSGIVAASVLRAMRAKANGSPRERLARFALCWLVVDYVVLTLVRTKFHHYLLPMLPPLALCAGVALDELCDHASERRFEMLLIAVPTTLLCGLDLAALPQRVLWLFNYDYVNMPEVGRAWPAGERYEYGHLLMAFAIIATFGTALLARGRRAHA